MLKKQENCGMLIIDEDKDVQEMKNKRCGGCQKQSCDDCRLFLRQKLHTDKEIAGNLAIKITERPKKAVGIAFDVGTTTVAASLWNLNTGECMGALSSANPQRCKGNDVVSRIAYCMENETEHTRELQGMITECMDMLAEKLLQEYQVQEPVSHAIVVGNTAMCRLALGVSVSGLAKAPFKKGYTGCVVKQGRDMGLQVLESAKVTILPAIEGYVGADALAVYTYVKKMGAGENSLIVDIGTNGEILFIGKNGVYTCSTAAGPALEGAAVQCGMSASAGAIAGIRLAGSFPGEDIFLEVIGDTLPKGICGSGLLDAMALLYKEKLLSAEGYLKTEREAAKDGAGVRLCKRLQTVEGENRFVLKDGADPVYLTGRDIRQLQLAKGAIRAGMETLLQKEKLTVEEIDSIYLAGAFGNYIRPESAVAIGLLPQVGTEKIIPIGNGAGLGAAMALLSEEIVNEMVLLSEKIVHVELAREKVFEELFPEYMNLP